MVFVFRCCLLCLVLTMPGCFGGPGSTDVIQNEGIPVADLLRQNLQPVAESGQLGSEKVSIEKNIELLSKEDSGKAAELSKDLKDLEGLSGAAAKAKANAMIGKL